jgi:hypothetical protein
VEDGVQGRQGGVAGERGVPGEGRAQGRTEGPQVGRRALGAAGDALGGHVVGRADQHADHGERLGVLDGGDAEVGEDDPPAVRTGQHVAGFDVAVQYAPGVHLAQRGDQAEADPGRLAGAQRPLLGHDPLQGAAGDQLHDDPQPVALVDHVVDADDVGVVDAGRGPRLAQGALTARAGVLRVESVDPHFLDGDFPVEYFVCGAPHPPHSPLAYAFDEPIALRHQQPRHSRQFTAPPQWPDFAPSQHSAAKSCGTSSSAANSGAAKGDEGAT